jgi:hypothetical protein
MGLEGFHILEADVFADKFDELHLDFLAVNILVKIKQKGFQHRMTIIKGGAGAQIEGNIAFDNKEHGFDCHYDRNTGVSFKYNTAYRNGKLGFGIEKGKEVTLESNIASENTGGQVLHGIQRGNSWQIDGDVSFISTEPGSNDFLKPKEGSGFERMGAYGLN